MITWHEEVLIAANIEKVWHLFDLDQMQRVMPQIVETTVLEKKEGVVGSTYQQVYREGKRTETYIVTDLEHEETATKKHNKSGFTLANMIEVETSITLIKIAENETKLIYSGQNKGLNFLGKLFMKLSSTKKNQQVVDGFLERVKTEALKEADEK